MIDAPARYDEITPGAIVIIVPTLDQHIAVQNELVGKCGVAVRYVEKGDVVQREETRRKVVTTLAAVEGWVIKGDFVQWVEGAKDPKRRSLTVVPEKFLLRIDRDPENPPPVIIIPEKVKSPMKKVSWWQRMPLKGVVVMHVLLAIGSIVTLSGFVFDMAETVSNVGAGIMLSGLAAGLLIKS